MDPAVIFVVFGVIFISELPDKSLFASLILGTRYKGSYVWLGAAAAFLVHVIIAVTAGKALTLLPHNLLEAIIALLFFAGALLMFFGKHDGPEDPEARKAAKIQSETANFWKVFGTSFGIVFIGEWGDITQIATANYTALYRHDVLSVAIGSILALWAVTALAIVVGSRLIKIIPVHLLQRVSGVIMLIFAIVSAYHAIQT